MVTANISSTETSIGRIVYSRPQEEQNRAIETTGVVICIGDNLSDLWIYSFAPEPYRVLRPIPIKIASSDRGWIGSFYDANIHASGGTHGEAIENLRSLILEAYEMLSEENHATLGPEPAKQLARLRCFIAPISRVQLLLQHFFGLSPFTGRF